MNWFTRLFERAAARPVRYFLLAFVVAILLLWLCLQVVAGWNDGGQWLPGLLAMDATSAGLQAVVGNAVVGASAVVALVVAVAALKASEAGNRLAEQGNGLSERANELGDPDYLLSHQAHAAYRKYGFLMGALISDFRLSRHSRDLAAYLPREVGGEAGPDRVPRPGYVRSNRLLEELRELLFDTAFSVASLETARVLDERNGTGEYEQHKLRKAFAGLNAALSAHIEDEDQGRDPEVGVVWVLVQATLLDRQVRAGIEAVTTLPVPGDGSAGQRFLRYLRQWMGEMRPVETGDGLDVAVRARAFGGEELAKYLGGGKPLPPAADLLKEKLGELFVEREAWRSRDDTDPPRIGLHSGMRVAALCGDHTTVLQLQKTAEEFAHKKNWEPVILELNSVASLADPPRSADDKRFFIYRVTRRTLPYLFGDGGLNAWTRGCVIVDGLRSAELGWVEDRLAEMAAEQARLWREQEEEREREPREVTPLHAFVEFMADQVYCGIQVSQGEGRSHRLRRERDYLAQDPVTREDEASAASVPGPKVLWLGIDYRELGREPPERLDDFTAGLPSIFASDQVLAVSDEVRELTGL